MYLHRRPESNGGHFLELRCGVISNRRGFWPGIAEGTRIDPLNVTDFEFMSNDSRYWFPAKRYGWGWGPPTAWQRWVDLSVWFAVIAAMAFVLMPRYRMGFLFSVLAMTVLLVFICLAKGEPPAWRWGGRDPAKRNR